MKTDLDKAMAELKSQIDDVREHTDLSIQKADERLEWRFALAEEQNCLKEAQTYMMRAVLHQLQNTQEQIKTSLDQLCSRFERR
jgi:hypothetical protein